MPEDNDMECPKCGRMLTLEDAYYCRTCEKYADEILYEMEEKEEKNRV